MRKLFLFITAIIVLTSCDNLKKKSSKDKDKEDTELTTNENGEDDEENLDDEKPSKSKRVINDEDEENSGSTRINSNSDDDDNSYSTSRDNTNISAGWSSEERNTFLNTCVSGVTSMGKVRAENYCSCMLKQIERIYPNAMDAGKLTKAQATELAKDCLR